VSDLYGSVWGALAAYIQSWVLPSTIGVGFFVLALLPAVEDKQPWSGLEGVSGAEAALLFGFATLIVSFVLASSARPLLRLLEGYTLRPLWLRKRWIEKQGARRRQLRERIAQSSSVDEQLRLREQLNQFPRRATWVLPTRLGNALRAGETYGWRQYGLSTVDLWTRLVSVAGDKVVEQLTQSRAVLDFFVALIGLSGGLVAATAAAALWAQEPDVLLWLLPLCLLVPLWYSRAVAAVTWHAQAMQALADLARVPLAEKLGIRLPGDLASERGVWEAVSDYAAWGPGWTGANEWISQIDEVLTARGAPVGDSEKASDSQKFET
jgi:hypothetical protein